MWERNLCFVITHTQPNYHDSKKKRVVLWPDWENVFIPQATTQLQRYQNSAVVLDWDPDFCKLQGKMMISKKNHGVREIEGTVLD